MPENLFRPLFVVAVKVRGSKNELKDLSLVNLYKQSTKTHISLPKFGKDVMISRMFP